MMKILNLQFILVSLVIGLVGCSSIRTEFFRGETRYVYNRGCRQYKQGEYDAARESFKEVLVLDPDYGPAHGALGNLALAGASYDSALAHYHKALRVDPELEADLRSLIMVAATRAARKPLARENIDLKQVYLLAVADKQTELEALLSSVFPLDILANDTLSITPAELGELQLKAAAVADPGKGSVRYRLFMAHVLFSARTDSALAAALIERAAPHAESDDKKRAYVLLGQVRERLGDFNLAVDAYLTAVNAGLPLTDVAHRLARIYTVNVESILPEKSTPEPVRPPVGTLQIELTLPLPKPALPEVGFERIAPEIVSTAVRKERGLSLSF